MYLLLLILGLYPGANSQDLVTLTSQRSSAVCCQSESVLQCSGSAVAPSLLGVDTIRLPGNISVMFVNRGLDNNNAFHYRSNNAEVIITYNPETNGMHGHAMTSQGKSYSLEFCGASGHVWKELDVANFGENKALDFNNMGSETPPREEHDQLVADAVADIATTATYYVKFYYTPEFAAVTSDIKGFIDQAIAETNQGYANSNVSLKVVKWCVEAATINDQTNSTLLLQNFTRMKPSLADLRGSADVAVLLVNSFDACGIGYFDSISMGATVAVSMKSCAVGYYSLGHEIGHNIGLQHNREVAKNQVYAYGHGYLIPKGKAPNGFRTIMAYTALGYETRINYYSNPSVTFKTTGTFTGKRNTTNNAAVLMLNRFSLAAVGDELKPCLEKDTSETTTESNASCSNTAALPVFPAFMLLKSKMSVADDKECSSLCANEPKCKYWAWTKGKTLKSQLCNLYKVKEGEKKKWIFGRKNC